jgi:hypothetical protein
MRNKENEIVLSFSKKRKKREKGIEFDLEMFVNSRYINGCCANVKNLARHSGVSECEFSILWSAAKDCKIYKSFGG